MRLAKVMLIGAVLAAGCIVPAAPAQAPPPSTVAVAAGPDGIALQTPGPVPAGPVRFEVTGAPGVAYVLLLQPGVSADELTAALARDDRTGLDSSLGLVSIQASTAAPGAVTAALRPGLTYHVLFEQRTDDPRTPPRRSLTSFTTAAAASGAALPAADATVRMAGLRFRGADVLPRSGAVRFENLDGVPHLAVAFPLRPGAGAARFARAMRTGKGFGRIVAGPPLEAQPPLSGAATDQVELAFPRDGRYGLVCFLGRHEQLGMYRVVTVR